MRVLIGIPPVISPELMTTLMEMGHGDQLVIGDANFPALSIARHTESGRLIRADSAGAAVMLEAILRLLPLDYAVECPVMGMAAPRDAVPQPIHQTYRDLFAERGYAPDAMRMLPRFDFYEEAKRSFAVLITGETARFANLIVKKGVVNSEFGVRNSE